MEGSLETEGLKEGIWEREGFKERMLVGFVDGCKDGFNEGSKVKFNGVLFDEEIIATVTETPTINIIATTATINFHCLYHGTTIYKTLYE